MEVVSELCQSPRAPVRAAIDGDSARAGKKPVPTVPVPLIPETLARMHELEKAPSRYERMVETRYC